MPFVNTTFDAFTVARLLEFFARKTPWYRRLWAVGSVLLLREVKEAAGAVEQQVLSPESFRKLCKEAQLALNSDPGISENRFKLVNRDLGKLIENNTKSYKTTGSYAGIDSHLHDIEPAYLSTWAAKLRSAGQSCRVDSAARHIAAHLLDSGYSTTHCHKLFTALSLGKDAVSLADTLDDLQARLRSPSRTYKILVLFDAVPFDRKLKLIDPWLSAAEASEWLKDRKLQANRQHGGLLMQFMARDPWAARDALREELRIIQAKVRLARGNPLRPQPRAWIDGSFDSLDIDPEQERRMDVVFVSPSSTTYDVLHQGPALNAAVDMLITLDNGNPGTAVAAGWGALESLFTDTENGNHIAGDRLADIVTCSFPRAELTNLSDQCASPHSIGIKHGMTKRECARLILDDITSGKGTLRFSTASHNLAIERMSRLSDPCYLEKVRVHLVRVMRRLYRQRNLVLHGGKNDAVALRTTLRTCIPLIGAGMDRVFHAHEQGMNPLQLALISANRLNLLGTPEAKNPVDLLETL